MSAATIPMPGDVARLIGSAAQYVENRSLLLDKFVFHKSWGLHEIKANDAHRWSLLRIADGGDAEIAREAKKRKDEADRLARKGMNPDKVVKLRIEAKLAEHLATTAKPHSDLANLRARHTRHLLGLFRRAYGDRAAVTIGQLEGRLAINLANSLIQNAGICLDRLFGLPYIPGSAVKGACRHAALAELKTASSAETPALLALFCAVFGTSEVDFKTGDLKAFREQDAGRDTDRKGAVSFLPAYPVNEARIVVDLTNVHYPLYYGGDKKRNIAPGLSSSLKEEKPQPNPFPAVEVGAQFAFCLVLNGINDNPALLTHACRWLETALTVRGLGAKTACGYGWFSLRPEALKQIVAEEAKEAEAAEKKARDELAKAEAAAKEVARKASLSPKDAAADELVSLNEQAFATLAKQLVAQDEIRQRAFIDLLRNHKEKRDRWKTWKKKKPDLAKSISDVCAELNLPPLP
ncbi:MAG: type III-B CRISPR module RAMP protein Cmr6 [Verrucomicrobiae bacterium]|nr:type III-B CRISPR module RAMP protein Cmr6 [Verrucomicrobiae bacterium]